MRGLSAAMLQGGKIDMPPPRADYYYAIMELPMMRHWGNTE